MSNGSFDFNEFVKDSKDVLVNPNYFATMKTSGGMAEPLIKAVIYGAIAGFFTFLWSRFGLGSFGFFGGGFMAIFSMTLGAVIGLFIGGVVMLILSSICNGNTDYEANVRLTSAVMVIMPVSAAIGFLTGINYFLGTIISLAVSILALWLTYKGLVQALKAKPETARILLYVFIVFVVLITLFTRR